MLITTVETARLARGARSWGPGRSTNRRPDHRGARRDPAVARPSRRTRTPRHPQRYATVDQVGVRASRDNSVCKNAAPALAASSPVWLNGLFTLAPHLTTVPPTPRWHGCRVRPGALIGHENRRRWDTSLPSCAEEAHPPLLPLPPTCRQRDTLAWTSNPPLLRCSSI